MDRAMVKAGLRAYKGIDEDIGQKLGFAKEDEDGKQYVREAEELRRVKREIIRCLNELPQLERDCIWRHYVNGEMWVRICQKYAYSERQIRNISNRGLDRLGKAFSRRAILRRYCQEAKGEFLH
jgi:DNA-directed RNA polymerase specialized sigma24 family protein